VDTYQVLALGPDLEAEDLDPPESRSFPVGILEEEELLSFSKGLFDA
jgi:hypothetical protein